MFQQKCRGCLFFFSQLETKNPFWRKKTTQRKVGSWLDQYINSHENKDLNETTMTFQEK